MLDINKPPRGGLDRKFTAFFESRVERGSETDRETERQRGGEGFLQQTKAFGTTRFGLQLVCF